MSEKYIKWLHSHGWDNKNPNYDLGGDPSKFEIALLPNNNLFDDVTPEEALCFLPNYRCFYIANKWQDTDYDVTLTFDNSGVSCTDVNFGALATNEVQKITFPGDSPTLGGYFICQLDWGPQLTIYWNGSYAAMAADMQTKIRMIKYHDSITVTASGSVFTVTFAGMLRNRKMGLIKIVQNNLVQSGIRDYRVDNTSASPATWNYQGCNLVQVHTPISAVSTTGIIHIPYPYNDSIEISNIPTSWKYMHLSYINFTGQLFNLQGVIPSIPVPYTPISVVPISHCLGNNDEVWVDMPDPQPVTVINVTRVAEGSPINQLARIIEKETNDPSDYVDAGTSFHVGLIKPSEGFFVWVKRVPKGQQGCQDKLSISLSAQMVS